MVAVAVLVLVVAAVVVVIAVAVLVVVVVVVAVEKERVMFPNDRQIFTVPLNLLAIFKVEFTHYVKPGIGYQANYAIHRRVF